MEKNLIANPVLTHNKNLQILIADQTHRVTKKTNYLKIYLPNIF